MAIRKKSALWKIPLFILIYTKVISAENHRTYIHFLQREMKLRPRIITLACSERRIGNTVLVV